MIPTRTKTPPWSSLLSERALNNKKRFLSYGNSGQRLDIFRRKRGWVMILPVCVYRTNHARITGVVTQEVRGNRYNRTQKMESVLFLIFTECFPNPIGIKNAAFVNVTSRQQKFTTTWENRTPLRSRSLGPSLNREEPTYSADKNENNTRKTRCKSQA